jgi:uncharacterized membrane protein YedE/YeeE
MDAFTPLPALAGGALIGLAASALLAFAGRIAGISGIVGGLLQPRSGDIGWRAAFVLGLFSAAVFGVGWGLAGLCPGPALTVLASGTLPPAAFVLAMLAGMRAAKPLADAFVRRSSVPTAALRANHSRIA